MLPRFVFGAANSADQAVVSAAVATITRIGEQGDERFARRADEAKQALLKVTSKATANAADPKLVADLVAALDHLGDAYERLCPTRAQ